MAHVRRAILAFFVAAGPAFSQDNGSPVEKVVSLIEELKTSIEADGVREQQAYDKFACWCEETTARKSSNIADAMADLKRLGTTVLEMKGKVAVHASEISELNALIRDNEEATTKATMMREKANKNYLSEKGEMEETIGALERGILALSGAGTKKLGLLEQKEAARAMQRALHKAIRKIPVDSALSPRQIKVLEAFVQDPAAIYDKKKQKEASYAPQSATIQGILKDMYDTFVKNLEKETLTEADQVQGYEQLMAVKTKELGTLKADLKLKKSERADAEASLADASQEMDDTSNIMAADTQFFEDTKKSCTAKADEWAERTRARTEELSGIEKGLEILTSPDAKEMFAKAIKPGKETLLQTGSVSLLQVSDASDATLEGRRAKAMETLRKMARTTGSLRLATLVSALRNKGVGHFDKIIKMIDEFLVMLKKEEKDDEIERDWCKAETFKNEEEAAQYNYKIEKADAKIAKLGSHLEALETSLQESLEEIGTTDTEIAALEDERKAEHKAFAESKADDEGAIKILEQALGALTAFYKNNKGTDMGEIQGSVNLLQKQDPLTNEDTPPETGFSDAGKSKGQSKGIVSILTMLKEDLEDEIKNGIKEEQAQQAAYDEAMGKAKAALKRLGEKKTNTKAGISTNEQDTDDTENDKEESKDLLEKEKEYLEEIKPDCDWMLENFQARRETRTQEMEGLKEAKGMLAGGIGQALVQVSPTLRGPRL